MQEAVTNVLAPTMAEMAGVDAIYSRAGEPDISLVVVPLGTDDQVATLQGVRIGSSKQDYGFQAILISPLGEPKRGDRLLIGAVIFEVKPNVQGGPLWRWSDNDRTRFRIHTTQVAA